MSKDQKGYTVYRDLEDYPGCYVLVVWVVNDDGVTITGEGFATPVNEKALDLIRDTMEEEGLTRTPRHVLDDPRIVEVWK